MVESGEVTVTGIFEQAIPLPFHVSVVELEVPQDTIATWSLKERSTLIIRGETESDNATIKWLAKGE